MNGTHYKEKAEKAVFNNFWTNDGILAVGV